MEEGRMKKIALGIDDFKEMIDKNTYFVDKSLFIKKILNNSSKVILLTRPRRFGKTLNLSMLKYFLEPSEIRDKNNKEIKDYSYLFEDLKIFQEREIVKKHLGRYPVITLSFKKVKAQKWKYARTAFKEAIAEEYLKYRHLLKSDVLLDFQKEYFENIMSLRADIFQYTSAIKNLSLYLNQYYHEKVFVLIDEYDTPLHYAKLNGYYQEMLDIIRALMVDGLKGNENLEKGVVAGIMKLSQESIFSSFNNPKIASLTDSFCKEYFGFRKDEVSSLLEYYDLTSKKSMVNEWYNGYLFGGETVIYNPWSILSFVENEDHLLQPYWINTGDTSLIKKSLQLDEKISKKYIKKLLTGEVLEKEVEQNIIYEDVFNNVEKAFSYLIHAGYLKAQRINNKDNKYQLSIPNREVRQIYIDILQNWFNREQKISELVTNLLDDLFALEIEQFAQDISSILLTLSSYYDNVTDTQIKKTTEKNEIDRYENFYHGLMLGIMVNITDQYHVFSNREFGMGRPDLVLFPKEKEQRAYILEFKNEYTSSPKAIADIASQALKQIKEKKYVPGIKKMGVNRVTKIGLGFKGKEVEVCWEDEENGKGF